VISVERVDAQNGWVYFLASPENATQRFLYRVRTDGSGKEERLTPASVPGVHSYNISPRGEFAIHLYSSFNHVPVTEVVRLPQHAIVRTMIDNQAVQDRLGEVETNAVGVFQSRHRRWRATRRLDDEAARFRSAETLSGTVLCLR
jgi:dipeptidyl-peptidase-4